MTKVELKLRNNKKISNFEKVKNIFVENGFFIISYLIEKNKLKTEPVALEFIEYWVEEKNVKSKIYKSRRKRRKKK